MLVLVRYDTRIVLTPENLRILQTRTVAEVSKVCQPQWTHTEVSYIRLVEAAVTTPCRVKLTRADKTAEAYILIRKLVVGITRSARLGIL